MATRQGDRREGIGEGDRSREKGGHKNTFRERAWETKKKGEKKKKKWKCNS